MPSLSTVPFYHPPGQLFPHLSILRLPFLLTIKTYLHNFKWHLSVVWSKRRQEKEEFRGIFSSSQLLSHASYCQTLKSVSLTFFFFFFSSPFTYFVSSEWLAGTHFDSLTKTRNFTPLSVPFAHAMGINPSQSSWWYLSGCFWVSNMLQNQISD